MRHVIPGCKIVREEGLIFPAACPDSFRGQQRSGVNPKSLDFPGDYYRVPRGRPIGRIFYDGLGKYPKQAVARINCARMSFWAKAKQRCYWARAKLGRRVGN